MRDQLALAPPDQGERRGAGSGQIAPVRGVDQCLHLDGKSTGQLCVMTLDALDGPGIRGLRIGRADRRDKHTTSRGFDRGGPDLGSGADSAIFCDHG